MDAVRRPNRRWLPIVVVLTLGAIVWIGLIWAREWSHAEIHSLQIHWDGNSVRLASMDDGPFVVTHLYADGVAHVGKETAALQQPVAIVDSDGFLMDKAVFQALTWLDTYGQKVPPPPVGSHLTALYFEPLQARH